MFKGTKQYGTSNAVAEAPLLDTIQARYEQYRLVTDPAKLEKAQVFHAGTALKDGALVTAGGRVLGVTCTAPTLREAVAAAYDAAEKITFTDRHMRHDIGRRALAAEGRA